MNRRCITVCAAVALSLLCLTHPIAARATKAATAPKRPLPAGPSRTHVNKQSKTAKTSPSRAAKDCAPCAAEIRHNSKGRASKKNAKTARKFECHPRDYVDPKIAKNYKAALRDMKRAGIKPRVTSVWRSSEGQAQLHQCSLSTRCRRSNPGLYRALPAGKSMHEAGFAVDIAGVAAGPRRDKHLTPQGRRIVGIMQKNGFKWRYGLADPVHFEADPRKYGYRDAQQAITKTQTTCQVRFANRKTNKKAGGKVASRGNHGAAKVRPFREAAETRARHQPAKARA